MKEKPEVTAINLPADRRYIVQKGDASPHLRAAVCNAKRGNGTHLEHVGHYVQPATWAESAKKQGHILSGPEGTVGAKSITIQNNSKTISEM